MQESSNFPAHLWQVPGKPVSVRLDVDLIERLAAAVREGARQESPHSVPWRGLEVGGLLLGRSGTSRGRILVDVQDFEPIESEHAAGPSLMLSDPDRSRLEARLARRRGKLPVVGFYRSHTRRNFGIEIEDVTLFETYFARASNVFLLIKPRPSGPPTAGFLMWEGGKIRSAAPYREFPFSKEALEAQGAVSRPAPAKPAEGATNGLGTRGHPPTGRSEGLRPALILSPARPVPVTESSVVRTVPAPVARIAGGVAALLPSADNAAGRAAPALSAEGAVGPLAPALSAEGSVGPLAPVPVSMGRSAQSPGPAVLRKAAASPRRRRVVIGPLFVWKWGAAVLVLAAVLAFGILSHSTPPAPAPEAGLFTGTASASASEPVRSPGLPYALAAVAPAPAPEVPIPAPAPEAAEPIGAAEPAAAAPFTPAPPARQAAPRPRKGSAQRVAEPLAATFRSLMAASPAVRLLPEPPPVSALPAGALDASLPGDYADPFCRVTVVPSSHWRLARVFGKLIGRSSVAPPSPLRDPAPVVPPDVRQRISGEVDIDVRVLVGATGAVEDAELLSKGKDAALADLALFASRRSEFAPAHTAGQDVPSEVVLRYRFGSEAQ